MQTKKKIPNPPQPFLQPIDRYFHICGIDILLSHRCEPFVLELNDRPSLSVTFPIEQSLKTNMIFDALKVMYTKELGGWQQILPPPDSSLYNTVLSQIQQQALKGIKKLPSVSNNQKNQRNQRTASSIPSYQKRSKLPPLARTPQ